MGSGQRAYKISQIWQEIVTIIHYVTSYAQPPNGGFRAWVGRSFARWRKQTDLGKVLSPVWTTRWRSWQTWRRKSQFCSNNVFSRSMKCSSLRRMVGKLGTMALRKLGKCPSGPRENRTLQRVKAKEKQRSQLNRNSAPNQRWAKRQRERKRKDKSRYPKLSYDRFQLISLNCIFGASKFCWIGKQMEQ